MTLSRVMMTMPVPKNKSDFGEVLTTVWRQALVDHVGEITLGGEAYPVRRTAKRGLAQVDFEFEGSIYRGLEQNPQTKSRWAKLARKGAKVMQYLLEERYIGVVVDGRATIYSRGGK